MSSFEKHYAGLNITASDNNGKMRPVSRVTLYVDDENVITAGDDTGLEISAECPNATQAIANALLARFKGFQYQAMSANDANIDPAVELGDSVTADGMYSVIARISDDGSGYVSVSAPGEEELEDEYPMDGPLTRAITQATDRKIAETRSSITKTADEIRAEITTATGELSSTIDQKLGNITLSVTNGKIGSSASIELSVDGKKQTNSIDMTAVRSAFANDQTAITIGAGIVTFNSNTFVVNSDNFGVTNDGIITAKAGQIAAWNIGKTSLYNGPESIGDTKQGIYMSPTYGIRANGEGANNYVTIIDGVITAVGADIRGKITATSGQIATWQIGATSLYSGLESINRQDEGIYLSAKYGMRINGPKKSDGSINYVKIGNDGIVHAEGAEISGTVNASAGVFNKVTIKDSSLGGTLDADGTFTGTHSGGTLSSTGGSYVGSINSGGTFSGGLSNAWGSYNGNIYGGTGNGGGVLSNCNLAETSLATNAAASAYFQATGSGGAMIYGSFTTMGGSRCSVTANSSSGNVSVTGSLNVEGSITSNGVKPRTMTTAHYGKRQLDAFETPLPTFSDYGNAVLDETGVLYIVIDPIFAETVDDAHLPTVFLTKYGEGDIWVERVEHDIVTVRGTPGLEFAWETRYAQANAGVERLRVMDFDWQDLSGDHDFEGEAAVAYEHSKDSIDYARMGYEYFMEFERNLAS